MLIKIINSALILFTLFMSIKHGWAGIVGKPESIEMFAKWNIGRIGVMILGFVMLGGSLLILFPPTFLYGNFINAACILFMITLFLQSNDLKGVAIEIPFLLLPLLILYLRHPLAK